MDWERTERKLSKKISEKSEVRKKTESWNEKLQVEWENGERKWRKKEKESREGKLRIEMVRKMECEVEKRLKQSSTEKWVEKKKEWKGKVSEKLKKESVVKNVES